MYLFDKKGNAVYVYRMNLSAGTANMFRKQEMMNQNGLLSCFKFETCRVDKNLGAVLGHKKNQVIDFPYSKLEYDKKFFVNYHTIKSDDQGLEALENYYNGLYNDANIIRVYDYDEAKLKLKIVRYLLANQGYKKILTGEGFLRGVISVPKSLYLFELLQKGKFDYLETEDISSLLKLFDIDPIPVDEISLESLDKLDYYGCGTATKDELISKVNGTQKVIQAARKQGRIR